MKTGDSVVSCNSDSGSYSEVDGPPGLVPRAQIGRLRWLMLTFDERFVVKGTGRFVAFRLDLDAGLSPQIPHGITLQHVYCAACSIGLIATVDDREVPASTFVARVKELSLTRCRMCGVGDRIGDEPCWVCLAREEQGVIRAVFGLERGVQCRL